MYIKVLLVCSQHRGYKEGQIAESFGKITTSLPKSGNHLPTIAWSNPANQHIYIYMYMYIYICVYYVDRYIYIFIYIFLCNPIILPI